MNATSFVVYEWVSGNLPFNYFFQLVTTFGAFSVGLAVLVKLISRS